MMKSIIVAMVAATTLSLSTVAAEWTIDKPHTSVNFSVKHLVITTVNGKFTDFDGTINFDGENLKDASVEMTVQTASVDTDNERRDKHLKSADFFDVENFPTMTFKSTGVIPEEGNDFKLVGDLTIRGVTKEVTFDCQFHGTAQMRNTTKAGFNATTVINRQDFGVNWSKTLDNGGLVAGNEVTIRLDVEANKVM
jgi:polyisoprenoid-binding protein YceI